MTTIYSNLLQLYFELWYIKNLRMNKGKELPVCSLNQLKELKAVPKRQLHLLVTLYLQNKNSIWAHFERKWILIQPFDI